MYLFGSRMSLFASIALIAAQPQLGQAQEAVKPWAHESELGVIIASGNTNSETYNFKQATSYVWETNKLEAKGRYVRAQTNGVETARNWDASLRYEKSFSDRLAAFVQHGAESDVFSGVVQRDNSDVGAKYILIKSDDTNWHTELGYRYSYLTPMVTTSADRAISRVRLYSETTQKFLEKANFKLWAEYLPSTKEAANDYQLNAEPSIAAPLSEMFSLKVGYLFKYNSVQTSGKYLDTFFTTSVLAKF